MSFFYPCLIPVTSAMERIQIMKRRPKSIQATLQIAFFIVSFAIFFSYMLYFVISETGKIKRQAFDAIEQNVMTVSSFVDSEISTLDTVAQNIAYSNLVKERFATYLDYSATPSSIGYDNVQNTKVLTDLLTAIIGPNRPVDQLYLYSLDKGVFGNGLDNSTSAQSVESFPWYEPLQNSPHEKIMLCNTDDRLTKYYSYAEGSHFLSLYCVYHSIYNTPQGIIEVKRSITSLTSKIKGLATSYGEKIYVYDSSGAPVYPQTSSADASSYYAWIQSDASENVSDGISTDVYERDSYIFHTTSDYSGFTTFIVVNNHDLLQPIYQFVQVNLIIFAVITLFTLFLSIIVAKVITIPITKIYSQIQSFRMSETDKSKEETFPVIDTHILELNALYSALVNMQQRAILSMEREVSLHNQEMQSRMLALQSQMNPHFLYNSLATIQSMADEDMNDEIINMCQTVSRILRYISSDKELLVSLSDDVQHVEDYLQCMKMRYEDDLVYKIDIPSEMADIKIPKLCLQLIVENSIKFATKSVKPPWNICITGKMSHSYWELCITDNGIGFSEEDIKALNEKIDFINQTALLPSLELNGMGLMNIYIRFKMLYRGNHIFRIGNLAAGGAIVTIGGSLLENMEEKHESI